MTYYIAPSFLKSVALHITKNYLNLPNVRVPLILGIHGRKGEGKSFQCDLIFERMKVKAFYISAGELESPDAGDPARLLRFRYREAADQIRKFGQMAVLMINDLDAGAGRMDAMTQYTVNTQMVNVTLMNIADNPTNVQLPGSYDPDPLPRVPIIVTGNDFSTLYAPLIRDGRMTKFAWEPSRADRIGILQGIFAPDPLSIQEIELMVDRFPDQAIDFFGAMRSQLYDDQVWHLLQEVGLDKIAFQLLKSAQGPPTFQVPQFSLNHLLEIGEGIKAQHQKVQTSRLSAEYLGNRSVPLPPLPQERVSTEPEFIATPIAPLTDVPEKPSIDPALQQQITQILNLGYEISIEQVDPRRYRMNSWQSCGLSHLRSLEQTTAAVSQCLAAYPGQYVRLVSINPATKSRVSETIIHRP